jgi:hypothetical protein
MTEELTGDLGSSLPWWKPAFPCLCPVSHHSGRYAGEIYSLEEGTQLVTAERHIWPDMQHEGTELWINNNP